MIVLQVLGVGLWAVLGLGGIWWLLTGRRLFGIPKGYREGWPLRVMGLAYVLLAAYLINQAFHGTFYADGVIFSYAFFAVALVVYYLTRRRKAQAADVSTPEA
jgi:hypothetical protein